jgi:hypothetical protein
VDHAEQLGPPRLGELRLQMYLLAYPGEQRLHGREHRVECGGGIAVTHGKLLGACQLDGCSLGRARAGRMAELVAEPSDLRLHLSVHSRERVAVPLVQLRLPRRLQLISVRRFGRSLCG